MKSPLSFGLIVAVSGALACSGDGDGGRMRGNGGSGATTGSTGGTSSGGTAGTSAGGSAGTASGGTAGTGSTGANYGPALVISADGTVKDVAGNTGINGSALVVASSMNPSAVADFRDGKLCMHGATAAGFTDYGAYWGAQINVDLKRGAAPTAGDAGAAPGDAGADAGGDAGGGDVALQPVQPWDPRPVNVVGFSFKIDGPMVAPVLSVSAAPTGRDPSLDPFCYRGALPPPAGGTYDVLFTDLRLACWDNPPVTSSVFQITEPATYTTLNNLGWQINAGPELAYQFDFCISEIKPILSN